MSEVEDDDFEFVLEPGKYWFVINREIWERYLRVLRAVWSKKSFRVATTTPGPGGDVVWVVLDVKKQIMVSATLMGAPTPYSDGETAESLAVFGDPEESWFDFDLDEMKNEVASWALKVHQFALGMATGGPAAFVNKKGMEVVQEIAEDPAKYLEKARNTLLMTVGVVSVATIAGFVVYKKLVD